MCIRDRGGSKLRQRFPVSLAHIKDLDRAEHGDFDFFFLCNDLSVFIDVYKRQVMKCWTIGIWERSEVKVLRGRSSSFRFSQISLGL